MKMLPALLLGAGLLASSALASAAPAPSDPAEAERRLVLDFYQRFFNRHQLQAAAVIAEDYRQHNPQVADGKTAFLDYFRSAFRQHPHAQARIVRSAVDGDLVWLHVHATEQPGDPGRAIVEIFRVRRHRIVEHWDVIQSVPASAANANGMF